MVSIIEDISKLTTIPDKALIKLIDKALYSIGDAVTETVINKKDVADIDIGIGTLYIKVLSDEVKYKFIPNNKLEKCVKDVVMYKQNLLTDVIENALVNKITNTYKDLI